MAISHLLLVTQFMCLAYAHPDCNHKRVVDQFFYMCNSYSSNSIKREAVLADGTGIYYKLPQGDVVLGPGPGMEPVIQAPQQGFGMPFTQVQLPLYPPVAQFPWDMMNNNLQPQPSFTVPFQDQQQDGLRRKGNNILVPLSAPIPNEPEDFASFNSWYLNPVYADADWPSAIERWRRKSFINEEIWRFVRNKCCVAGCPFPDEYLELDKRVNICGMR